MAWELKIGRWTVTPSGTEYVIDAGNGVVWRTEKSLLAAVLRKLQKKEAALEAKQATIDRLMLEHASQNMTDKQRAQWAKAQKPARGQDPLKARDSVEEILREMRVYRAVGRGFAIQGSMTGWMRAGVELPLKDRVGVYWMRCENKTEYPVYWNGKRFHYFYPRSGVSARIPLYSVYRSEWCGAVSNVASLVTLHGATKYELDVYAPTV